MIVMMMNIFYILILIKEKKLLEIEYQNALNINSILEHHRLEFDGNFLNFRMFKNYIFCEETDRRFKKKCWTIYQYSRKKKEQIKTFICSSIIISVLFSKPYLYSLALGRFLMLFWEQSLWSADRIIFCYYMILFGYWALIYIKPIIQLVIILLAFIIFTLISVIKYLYRKIKQFKMEGKLETRYCTYCLEEIFSHQKRNTLLCENFHRFHHKCPLKSVYYMF